jgi:hypothetical protein
MFVLGRIYIGKVNPVNPYYINFDTPFGGTVLSTNPEEKVYRLTDFFKPTFTYGK